MDMEESDAVLVVRVRQGDASAFDSLVRRHLGAAYAVALARLREPAEAEDVCQDAFITALQKIEECRQPERFSAWFLSIVRNRAHDHARRATVRLATRIEDEEIASNEVSPLRYAERSEREAHLLNALGSLTELQREVLMLYDLEGWSHREIAELLGISEGSARVHLHNGRRALREAMVSGVNRAAEPELARRAAEADRGVLVFLADWRRPAAAVCSAIVAAAAALLLLQAPVEASPEAGIAAALGYPDPVVEWWSRAGVHR